MLESLFAPHGHASPYSVNIHRPRDAGTINFYIWIFNVIFVRMEYHSSARSFGHHHASFITYRRIESLRHRHALPSVTIILLLQVTAIFVVQPTPCSSIGFQGMAPPSSETGAL